MKMTMFSLLLSYNGHTGKRWTLSSIQVLRHILQLLFCSGIVSLRKKKKCDEVLKTWLTWRPPSWWVLGWQKWLLQLFLLKYIFIIQVHHTRHLWQLGRLSGPHFSQTSVFWRANFQYLNQPMKSSRTMKCTYIVAYNMANIMQVNICIIIYSRNLKNIKTILINVINVFYV